ncbi:MAG: twitching motility protein [Microgenomates group bacterium GW2011_GWF2_45_18]|nr:MAG: twitching motility protein [Microgenomates group bacterium GW2011_GWF1_44_10]KKU01777.1 MAG: twitching motility protein [Microgenomates group bacterium GW2011_GWF2_45_18]OGJ41492.1 MAG: type IV pili twitching motility protein PilT [Candidatus Pacebacteria bacterium RIFOXYB1_FULL_44_10]HAU98919.1 type IV pili twitching motility protein PilT [Candidatus Paceibacterota bacterium]HAX01124.1 type IV pili twitching motility protein PilT [Candidatus Paceibacterota bacterium]
MDIQSMLSQVVQQDASDLHLLLGIPPMLRVHGRLGAIPNTEPLTSQTIREAITPLLAPEQRELLNVNKEVDFGYQFGEFGRFRVNVYHTQGEWTAALRLIPSKIKSLEDLGMPEVCNQFSTMKQGLVLVTGPTGHGKSSTLAAIIDQINKTRSEHILTIEDPIEFVHKPIHSIISQRELHADTHSWEIALRSALREDPDVVLVGEMRDYETIAAALTVAETGHLVFATLHTNSASQTIDRIIDVFPAAQQAQIRSQLAMSIQSVLSQRLVPSLDGKRCAAVEVLMANGAVRNLIRDGKTFQLDNVIQTSAGDGMITIESSLAQLVMEGKISYEEAEKYALRPDDLEKITVRSTTEPVRVDPVSTSATQENQG